MTDTNFSSNPRDAFIIESLRSLNTDLRLRAAVANLLRLLNDYYDSQASSVILLNFHAFTLQLYSQMRNSGDSMKRKSLKDGPGIVNWRSANISPLLVNDFSAESEFKNTLKAYLDIDPANMISVPLFAEGEFFGLIQVWNTGREHGFAGNDLDTLKAFSELAALTLRNSWILEEAIRGSVEARSLYEVGIALSSSLDLDELLQKILHQLRKVIECNSAVIYLVDPRDRTINQIVGSGLPDSMQEKLHLKIGQGITGRVAETGKAVIVSDVKADPYYIAFRPETQSEMAVPLKVGDNIIGAFNLESDKAGAYGEHDLELLNAFASLAAITIERARLYSERMASKRLEDELAIARRIQITFLPSKSPEIDGFDVAGLNIPSAAVGGDYYDFIPIVDKQLGVAIGDVSGKGIPASLIMAAFRASLKAEIRNNFAIRAILSKVNDLLYESIERDNYVTAIYGVLDSKNRVFTFSNAGHNPPILRRQSGQVEYLREGGLALGIFPDSAYEERPVALNSGDIVLFYTDGVTEAKNNRDEEFGETRLLESLEESHSLSAKEIIDFVVDKTNKFISNQYESDDLTLVVIKTL